MKTLLRVLVIEDSEDDAHLVIRQIKRAGYDIDYERIDTAYAMTNALTEKSWDIVLSDYAMPHFNGLEALKLLKETNIDIPFIIISGTIGEETAVEAMKAGAHDYIMKNNMHRLLPAVERELREAKNRSERRLLEIKKRLAEDALRESEERYRRITVGLTDYLYTVRIENGLAVETIQSEACLAVTGYTADEFAADTFLWFRMIVKEDREMVKEQVRKILSGENIQPIEHRIIRKDGTIRWVNDTTVLFKNDLGQLISYDGVIKDITVHKLAEFALRASEERFSKIFQLSPIAIAIFRVADGIIVDVNDEFIKETGYTYEEIIGHTTSELQLYANTDEWDIIIKTIKKNGILENYEFKTRNKLGRIGIGLNTTIEITLGEEKHYLALIKDITERKQVEDELRKLSRAVEQSPATIVITDLKSNIEYVNPKFTELTGYTREEAMGQNPHILKSGDMSSDNYTQLWTTITSGKEWRGEFHNKKKNGELYWEFASISPIFDTTGNTTHYLAVKEDITDRKLVEKALLDSERKYRIVADNTYNWEFWTDPDGKFIYCSPSCYRVTGFTANELFSNPQLEFEMVHPDYRKIFLNHLQNISNNYDDASLQFKIIHKDGTERWIEHICRPVFDNDNSYMGRRGSNSDITERKEVDRKLLNAIIFTEETERNRFAQDLHDGLGPMLSTVKLYFQWLSETNDIKKRENITKTGLQNIDEAILAVREISNKLSPRVLNGMGLLPALKYLTYRLNETQKIKINVNCDMERRYVSQVEVTLYRIFSELINNTLKYAKAKTISINILHDDEKKKLEVSYCDDGIGFNLEEVLKNTKGMGLYNMQQRIETLKGFINFDTDIGKPLNVKILLPIKEIA